MREQYDPNNPNAGQFGARTRRRERAGAADDRATRFDDRSTSSSWPAARGCASTTPGASTARSSRSTTARTISRKARPDRRHAQRGLRPHRAHPRRRHARRARVQHRQQGLPGRADRVQRHRGDSWHRQEGRDRHARRPPRFVALGDRRHRQRDRLRDDDGGGADSEGDRRAAAADDSRRALERRGAGHSRIAGVREGALRIVRESEAGIRDARRVPEHRLRHRPRARRERVRSAVGGRRRPQRARAVRGSRRRRRRRDAPAARWRAPTARRSTTPGLPGIGFGQDPIEYNTHTHHTNLDNYERIVEERREGLGDLDCGVALSAGDARRDAAAASRRRRCRLRSRLDCCAPEPLPRESVFP